MHSNYTLRFPRTSREAYGYEVSFHDANEWDRRVFICAVIGAAFVIGMMVGGLV